MRVTDIQIWTDNADNFIKKLADVTFTLTEGDKRKECSFKIPAPDYNFPVDTALYTFYREFNQEIKKFQEELNSANEQES